MTARDTRTKGVKLSTRRIGACEEYDVKTEKREQFMTRIRRIKSQVNLPLQISVKSAGSNLKTNLPLKPHAQVAG
jgi:hypothetical protein